MSNYSKIDLTIFVWVEKNGLSLFTQYQDSEVRSVEVVGDNGQKFQIWIDCPQGNRVAVHVWNYKKIRQDWEVDISELPNYLDNAIDTARSWGKMQPGSKRSLDEMQ